MKVIHLAKAAYHTDDSWWNLLHDEDGAQYILVNCEASFVSYECLIKLNDEESRDFHGLGWLSLQHLANRINYFSEEYKNRRVTGSTLSAAIEAIK